MSDEIKSIESIINDNLSSNDLQEFNRIYYGRFDNNAIKLKDTSLDAIKLYNLDIQAYKFDAAPEEMRAPRVVRVGLIQHSIVIATDQPINEQRNAIYEKVSKLIDLAAKEDVNILCLQEAWPMPFRLDDDEKVSWLDLAESAENGPTTEFLKEFAFKNQMVIVSPIIERDDQGKHWNTAVIISDSGKVLGKHRKNHLPCKGSHDETRFFDVGNMGHPVFETRFGRIAVNICYGRHHPQNWMMFGLNGAEIVFNPAATVAGFGESFWGIEARNAAIANNFYTCSINRVGIEEFKLSDGLVRSNYNGSSYVTAPDGIRTPGLSRTNDGILITEIDLNLCRQIKDKWGYRMTQRLPLYAEQINNITSNNQ